MIKKTFLTALIFLCIASLSFAQSCSITSVSLTPSSVHATTGTSVSISASAIASESCTESATFLTKSGPTNLEVSDPIGGSYSAVSFSATKTFTVSAPVAGTYTYNVRASSTESTTPGTFYAEDPGVFTVIGSPSTASKYNNETLSLSISIYNPTSELILTSYSLSYSTGFSFSGDSTSSSSISVPAGSTKVLQWTVSCPSCTGAKTINLQLGNNEKAFSSKITYSVYPTPTPSPSPSPSPTPSNSNTGGNSPSGGSSSTPIPSPTPTVSPTPTIPRTSPIPQASASPKQESIKTPQPSIDLSNLLNKENALSEEKHSASVDFNFFLVLLLIIILLLGVIALVFKKK